jgi:hypothetical protein
MTVAAVEENNVECLWISDDGELFRETIPSIALTVLDEEEEEEEELEVEDADDAEEHDEDDEDEDEDEHASKKKRRSA